MLLENSILAPEQNNDGGIKNLAACLPKKIICYLHPFNKSKSLLKKKSTVFFNLIQNNKKNQLVITFTAVLKSSKQQRMPFVQMKQDALSLFCVGFFCLFLLFVCFSLIVKGFKA